MNSTKKSTIAAGVVALLLILGVFVSPSPAPIPPPCIDVWKWVEPDVSKIGDEVVYTICVNNCGVMHLLNVLVVDTQLGGVLPGFPPVLAPGQTVCLDFPYTIQPDDSDPLLNVVMASGVDPGGTHVEDFDTAMVDLVKVGIDITKTVDNPNPCFGDTVTYTICIENTGEWALEHVVVTDPHLGGILPGFPAVLAPGETACIDFPYAVQDDDPCPLVNCAKVRSDPLGPMTNCVKDEDGARICPERCGGDEGCTPGYWKNHPDCWECFEPDTPFSAVFGRVITIGSGKKAAEDPTLMEALNGNGGGVTALARHAVAAILNACDPDIAYPVGVGEIIDVVAGVLDLGEPHITEVKDILDEFNNFGCPQDAHCRPHPED
jgi:hypothetical protein